MSDGVKAPRGIENNYFKPKVCAFNGKYNFIAISNKSIKHDPAFGSTCVFFPDCARRWSKDTNISKILVLEGQCHASSGKEAWACAAHSVASEMGFSLQLQGKRRTQPKRNNEASEMKKPEEKKDLEREERLAKA